MRYSLFSLFLVASCSGVFGVKSGPAQDTKSCPAARANGKLAPNGSAHVADLLLTAGDQIVVEFEASKPGELTAEISGPFITKNGATFATQTVAEFPTDEISSEGHHVSYPPKIDQIVHEDGRYEVRVLSTSALGELSWSACAKVVEQAGI